MTQATGKSASKSLQSPRCPYTARSSSSTSCRSTGSRRPAGYAVDGGVRFPLTPS